MYTQNSSSVSMCKWHKSISSLNIKATTGLYRKFDITRSKFTKNYIFLAVSADI